MSGYLFVAATWLLIAAGSFAVVVHKGVKQELDYYQTEWRSLMSEVDHLEMVHGPCRCEEEA